MRKKFFKTVLLFTVISFVFSSAGLKAQKTKLNHKWQMDLAVGTNIALSPFTKGSRSSNGFPHLAIGGQKMLSDVFGIRSAIVYDHYSNSDDNTLYSYSTSQLSILLEGVLNTHQLFQQPETSKFDLFIHAGMQISRFYVNKGDYDGRSEKNGGIVFGLTPVYRLSDKLALLADWSYIYNIRQDFTWNGLPSSDNDRIGSKMSVSVGLQYSF